MSSRLQLLVVFLALLVPRAVFAHGSVANIIIAGETFKGNVPNGKENPSAIRLVNTVDPVKGADNPDIVCGAGSHPASRVAAARPGDSVEIDWVGGGGVNWPHEWGPMLTYLAKCDGDCTEFDTRNADWFKIQQIGLKKDGTTDWFQKDLRSRKPAELTLPANLAPGSYIMRHEIIALHLGTSVGGAEFYPSCSQINVSGSGTGVPASNELVKFPGAYRDDDPGIFVPKIFDRDLKYTFPGPKIAAFVNDDSPSSASTESTSTVVTPTSSTSSTSSTSITSPSSSASPSTPNGKAVSSSGSTGKCKSNKKRSTHIRRDASYRPKTISRIMRGFADHLIH